MRISDWSSDVCSSDLGSALLARVGTRPEEQMRAVKLTRIEQIGADRCGEQWIVDLQRKIDSARSAARPARPDLDAGLGVAEIDAPRRRALGLRYLRARAVDLRIKRKRADVAGVGLGVPTASSDNHA